MVQSSVPKNSRQPRGKNKKNCNKNNSLPKQSGQTTQDANARGDKSKRNVKYPCILFKEDHRTKDCPRLANVHVGTQVIEVV